VNYYFARSVAGRGVNDDNDVDKDIDYGHDSMYDDVI